MQARDILLPDPAVVTPNEPIALAAVIMRERGIDLVPVVNTLARRQLVGTLTLRDVAGPCREAEPHAGPCRVRERMTPGDDVVAAAPGANLLALATMIRRSGSSLIPVMGERRALLGVVTAAAADAALLVEPASR